jgi:hypothetical protein
VVDNHQQAVNDGMWADRYPPLFLIPGVQSREMSARISEQDMSSLDERHAVLLPVGGILGRIVGESQRHHLIVLQLVATATCKSA